MSYNSYKPRYSLYQPVASPIPGGGCAPHPAQYQRRSVSAGNLYRNPMHSGLNLGRAPRFTENGFVPAYSSASSSASLAASAAVTTTTTSTSSAAAAAVPDRYHRQKHSASLSTHSLPSLSPSIKSSDLDTSSTQTSTSSISSWTDEKDRAELPQIKESAVERVGISLSESELSRTVLLSEQLEQLEQLEQAQAQKAQKAQKAREPDSPKPALKVTPQVSPKTFEAPSTPQKAPRAHPSQRTSNQAVEEALAKLNASGESPPSAEPAQSHRRRSSADSRTSLILPSERRYDANREQEKRDRLASAKTTPEKQRPRSVLDHDTLRNTKTRASGNGIAGTANGNGNAGSAKTGPVLNSVPVRPPNSSSIRAASMPSAPRNSRPPSISSISTNTPRHSRTDSQFSMAQPIAYAPVRGEREPKPKFSQKIKGLFRRNSTLHDSASISSNMSGKSGLSSMSVRSTSSTFSFRSISQSSKRLFKKNPKIDVSGPTFEQTMPPPGTPPQRAAAPPPPPPSAPPQALEYSQHQSLPIVSRHSASPPSLKASTAKTPSPYGTPYGSNSASRSPSPTPNPHGSASPIPIANPRGANAPARTPVGVPMGDDDDQGSLSIQDETLDVPDTLFPRSLDDVAAVAHIRNSVERVASLDRKGSVRSVRSLHKPNDEEKVPNVQEVRVEPPEDDDDDIFGKLDSSGLDLALPKHIKKRGVNFASQVMIYDTFSSFDYDRRPEPATCNRLTPALAQQIKQELNNVKMTMEIHRDSRAFTHFF